MLFNFSHFLLVLLCLALVSLTAEELTVFPGKASTTYLFGQLVRPGHELLFQLHTLCLLSWTHFIIRRTATVSRLTPALHCAGQEAVGRGGLVGVVNGQLQCRTAGRAMGMAFVVFENGISACNFQQFASSTSTLLFAAPFRIRVLDIWCFITLVKCIQFNAPFSLHLASMPGRAAHGSDTLTSLHLSQQ